MIGIHFKAKIKSYVENLSAGVDLPVFKNNFQEKM